MSKAHQETLTIDTLGELSAGSAGAIINAALNAAVRDTEDRGEDKKARKVVIEIEFKKASADSVSMNVKAKTTLPPYATEPTIGEIALAGNKPQVRFSPASRTHPDQPAIPGTRDG